jgi:environmental stress-induced protein Ves
MPWKNGGGETTEVAIHPAGASLDAFDWRISMARIRVDGPFSAFVGIDRTLAILTGAGIRLALAGQPPVELTQSTDPYSFPADVATSATLLGGAVTDLNVMTRRGRYVARVREGGPRTVVPLVADTTCIVCAAGSLVLRCTERPAQDAYLDCGDAALFDRNPGAIGVDGGLEARFLVVELDRVPGRTGRDVS